MAPRELGSTVRVSKIAGRYLVFDPDDVAKLRRQENTNGTLVGTVPQQPTQNMFLGLPIELRPEEVEALVHKNAAYVVDDVAAHSAALRSSDPDARRAYVDSLRRKKQAAHKVFAEWNSQKKTRVAERLGRPEVKPSSAEDDADSSAQTIAAESSATQAEVASLAVTPTSSSELIPPETDALFEAGDPPPGPLCRFLQSNGYYMSPGLRFGSRYSVYPGDPLRFHAHFMANQYDWHEEIPILDLVGGGRLATAVKKSFLIGGQQPGTDPSQEGPVRTFSIEWASM